MSHFGQGHIFAIFFSFLECGWCALYGNYLHICCHDEDGVDHMMCRAKRAEIKKNGRESCGGALLVPSFPYTVRHVWVVISPCHFLSVTHLCHRAPLTQMICAVTLAGNPQYFAWWRCDRKSA